LSGALRELLAEMGERGERHDGRNVNGRDVQGAPRATPEQAPTLSDLGVTKTQSSRWHAAAALPVEEFEKQVVGRAER
jgi:hypothetical protein